MGYKLKEGENQKTWLKSVCDKLNEETEGVEYKLREWDHGFCIEVPTPNNARQIAINWKPTRWKTDGDIEGISVRADDIYRQNVPYLNRQFKASKKGSVNIQKIHRCVLDRLKIFQDYEEKQTASIKDRNDHIRHLTDALEGSGIEIEHHSDYSGFSLLYDDTSFNCEFSGNNEVKIKLGRLYVPDEKIPAVLEALQQVTRIIKEE
jgi:hypothetical protein